MNNSYSYARTQRKISDIITNLYENIPVERTLTKPFPSDQNLIYL